MGLLTKSRRLFKKRLNEAFSKDESRATTIPLDRPLSAEERAIAQWLLLHASDHGDSYLPQLEHAQVIGQCSCGCPTVDLRVSSETLAAEPVDNPVADAIGEVNGNMVGVTLLQHRGYLATLEVYDLSEIERPYGLPDIKSLRPFENRVGHQNLPSA